MDVQFLESIFGAFNNSQQSTTIKVEAGGLNNATHVIGHFIQAPGPSNSLHSSLFPSPVHQTRQRVPAAVASIKDVRTTERERRAAKYESLKNAFFF